jgi:transcription elongation factor/antiterminator RfaH
MKEWYVVNTNPREDIVAMAKLRQDGFDVYQPLMQKYVFHARKKTLKKVPLFPNYIFVNSDDTEIELFKVKWCHGIRRMLIDNNNPVPISAGFIDMLKAIESQGEGVIKKPVDYEKGEHVRVMSGPMKDVIGIFESWDSDEGRVRILVEIVNQQAKVVLHASMLEKA